MALNRIGRSPLGVPYRSVLGVLTRPVSGYFVCVGGTRSSTPTGTISSVWRVSSAGVVVWGYDTGGIVRDIAIDAAGNVYVAGDRASNLSVWAIDKDGNELWTYDTGDNTLSVDVDSSGNVFVGGQAVGSPEYDIWKLDTSGAFVAGHLLRSGVGRVERLRIDTDNKVIAAGFDSSGNGLHQITNDLSTVDWSAFFTGFRVPNDMAVGGSGTVYAATDFAGGAKEIRKYDTGGSLVWTENVFATAIRAVAISPGLNIGAVGRGSASELEEVAFYTDTPTFVVDAGLDYSTSFNARCDYSPDSHLWVCVDGLNGASKNLFKIPDGSATVLAYLIDGPTLSAIRVGAG